MGKVPVILEVKLPVKEAQNKIGVGEKTHGQACDGPPVPDLLVANGLCNDRTGQGMRKGIHGIMVTRNRRGWQPKGISKWMKDRSHGAVP